MDMKTAFRKVWPGCLGASLGSCLYRYIPSGWELGDLLFHWAVYFVFAVVVVSPSYWLLARIRGKKGTEAG